jgi:hypothetical protein
MPKATVRLLVAVAKRDDVEGKHGTPSQRSKDPK